MRHVAVSVLLFVASSAFAQVAGTGSIQGTITDPSGGTVPGATVTATNVATGVNAVTKTTSSGVFAIPTLTPGEYSVTMTATGFQTLKQEHVVVDALQTVPVNGSLQLG